MPRDRVPMRNIREVLRLKAQGLSVRQMADSLGIGRTTVGEYLRRAAAAKITWPLPEGLGDDVLEQGLFPTNPAAGIERPTPEWPRVHVELCRKHVTLALLWHEYKVDQPDGYAYSQYCALYRKWVGTLGIWMHQEHKAGENLFVDYSGNGIPMIDPSTGLAAEAQLFVAVLGASSYTYAEATMTQTPPDWIQCHVHALAFFGGVPRFIVPDQTRTAVRTPCRYEPELNPTYAHLARHYDTCILPERPASPKDKAKVEAAMLLAQHWSIAALRHRLLVGLDAVNAAVRELLGNPGYYSVPFQHAHKQVDICATATTVEIFLNHVRVASHVRSHKRGGYTTAFEHMPRVHQKHLEWTPSRIISWGKKTGPATAELLERIMVERPQPEQGYRACLGILRLAKRFGDERVEKACARAIHCRACTYRSVESILKNNLENKSLPERGAKSLPMHQNVRGSQYYA